MNGFDDFGIGLYHTVRGTPPESYDGVGDLNWCAMKRDDVVPRWNF